MDEHTKYLVRQYKCKQSGPCALAGIDYGRGGCEHTETDGTICQLWVVHACLLLSFSAHLNLFLSIPFSSSESVLEDCPGWAHQTASGARVSCQTSKQSLQCGVRPSSTLSLFAVNGKWLARTTLLSILLHCYYLPKAVPGICLMQSAWSEFRKVDSERNMSLCSYKLWHSLDSWQALMEEDWHPKSACLLQGQVAAGATWHSHLSFRLGLCSALFSFFFGKDMPIRKWNTSTNYSQGPVKEAKLINRLFVASMRFLLY